MNTVELNKRLLAVGDKIKAKGWASASIDIGISYLACFDREPGPLDPMISYRPSIRASTRDRHNAHTTHDFVRDSWDIKTLEHAIAKLEESADQMPTRAAKTARIEKAKAKLTDDERRLLGVG